MAARHRLQRGHTPLVPVLVVWPKAQTSQLPARLLALQLSESVSQWLPFN